MLRAGVNLRLACPVESPPPPPIITWTKDGQAVHIGWERFRVHADVLRVRAVNVADSGVYTCHAINGFGTIDVTYLVYVYGRYTHLYSELTMIDLLATNGQRLPTHSLDRFFSATRFLILFFSLFFVFGPCARLSWPFRQLLSAR